MRHLGSDQFGAEHFAAEHFGAGVLAPVVALEPSHLVEIALLNYGLEGMQCGSVVLQGVLVREAVHLTDVGVTP
ncbi:MAG: hypothetical protein ACREMZ_15665 [Gemmatimonadales bacterium]